MRIKKQTINAMAENLNRRFAHAKKETRIKLLYYNGRVEIALSNPACGTIRTLRANLTNQEAYDILLTLDYVCYDLLDPVPYGEPF